MYNQEIDNFARNYAKKFSQSVFATEDDDKGILITIAKNGPQLISELEKPVKSYGPYGHDTRWAIKRRLTGTTSFIGLIPYEYIYEKENEEKIRGNKGMMYYLTIKGMLSILPHVPIEKNYLFKKYVKFLRAILDRKIDTIGQQDGISTELDEKTKLWLLNILSNYIKYKIYSFLVWHDANEVSLKYKTNMSLYFEKFFKQSARSIASEIPQTIRKSKKEIYSKILRQSLLYEQTLHSLDMLFDETFSSDVPKEKLIPLRDNLAMVSDYIVDWFFYFERLQLEQNRKKQYSVKPIPYIPPEEPEIGIDLEYEGKDGNKKIILPNLKQIAEESIRNELNLDIPIKKIWNKEFDSFKMTQYGRIPA